MPTAASGPRGALGRTSGRKPGPGPRQGKENAAREAHPRCSGSISPHPSDVNTPGRQSETFRAPAVALRLYTLPESATGDRCGAGARAGTSAPSPSDCVIFPGGGD